MSSYDIILWLLANPIISNTPKVASLDTIWLVEFKWKYRFNELLDVNPNSKGNM